MKVRNLFSFIMVIGLLSLFTSEAFAKDMSVSERAYFKKKCIKSGGRIGTKDGQLVCANSKSVVNNKVDKRKLVEKKDTKKSISGPEFKDGISAFITADF